jgi:hypothetical protein
MTIIHLRKRRAVSQIIVSLILVAIVATVGSTVLFRGLGEINLFSLDLNSDKTKMDTLREDLIFENIHLNSTSNKIQIYVANIGTTEIIISTISVVKSDTQEMIVPWANISKKIQIDSFDVIEVDGVLSQGNQTWSDDYYREDNYKISLSTSKGNFFTTIAKPYNT